MKSLFKKYSVIVLALSLLFISGTMIAQTVTQTFSYTGALQSFTVPAGVTSVTITAKGAEGGRANAGGMVGGLGGSVTGTFSVVGGSQLQIVVGGRGADGSGSDGYWSSAGGGGGGSFVAVGAGVASFSSPLIAAGGGGGGFAGSFSGGHVRTNGGAGGVSNGGAGTGGSSPSGYGGGGSGITGNGATGGSCQPAANGGQAISAGAAGGANGNCLGTINNVAGRGGFGGGGGANWGSGGGGGYTGGNANVYTGTPAQGGTSYTNPSGTGASFVAGTQSGNGLVTITYLPNGQTLNFDGNDDVVEVSSGINIANQSFTFECWAKMDAANRDNVVAGQGPPGVNTGLHIGWRSNNVFTFAFYANDLNTPAAYSDLGWHHWACTYSTNGVTRVRTIYRDGIQVAQDFPGADFQGTGSFYIGRHFWGANFQGSIDEARIWNRALCQAEIQNNMNCEIPTSGTNLLANYHFNQGINSSNNAGVTSLTDASGNGNNGSLYNFALNGSTSNWIAPGAVAGGSNCPAYVPPSISASSNSPIIAGNTLNLSSTGGFATYSWTGPNGFTSTSQNPSIPNAQVNANGTYTVKGTTSGGCSGTATTSVQVLTPAATLNFDGTNDYVNHGMSITNTLDLVNTLTVEAWVYPTSNSGLGCIVGNYNTNIWDGQLQFLLRRDNTTYGVYINNGSYFIGLNTAANTVVLNRWQHVAATWDGSQVKIYLNGVLANTANHAGSSFPTSAHEVWIGGNQMNNTENFRGNIDEVRIWSRALCQAEFQNYMNCEAPGNSSGLLAMYHFNQGADSGNNASVTTLNDASGNGINGTLNNFALIGSTSNWVAPGANLSGTCSTVSCCVAAAIVCPENVTVNTEPGRCGATVNFAANATGTTPQISYSHNPGTFFPVGTTVVTATANNACGTASCTFTVRVVDNEAPAISCPAPVSVSCASSVPAPNPSSVTAADNCSVTVTFVSDVTSNQTCANRYTVTRTYRATDPSGNYRECTQVITVNDATPPVITCPANITVNNAPGRCDASVTVPVPAASDNCGGGVSSSAPFAGSDPNLSLWIDATQFATSNGGGLSGIIDDASGFNRPLTTNAVYETSSFNGKPAVRYNNNQTATSGAFNTNANTYIFTTVEIVAPSNNWASVFYHWNRDNGLTIEQNPLSPNSPPSGTAQYHFQTGNDNSNVEQNITYGVRYIMAAKITGGNARSFTLYRDNGGVLQNLGTTSNSSFGLPITAGQLFIGRSDVGEYTNMKMGEFIYFQGALPVSEASIVNYLYSKWLAPPATAAVSNNFNGTSNASGIYPVGVTTVVWTTTDACGNSSTCTQTVTVVDNEAPGGGGGSSFPAPAIALSNVPEAAGYNVVYSLDIPAGANWDAQSQVPYTANNTSALASSPYTRVAYMMQLDNNWAWVSFNAHTNTITNLGIPTEYIAQQSVSSMNVFSNVPGIVTGTGINTGNIEFWSDCYGQAAGNGSIPAGNNGLYDFNDSHSNPDCYGSLQIHNYGANQTIMGYNRWSCCDNSDIGIGNQIGGSGHPDWTFAVNAGSYSARKLYVLVNNASAGLACVNKTIYLDAAGNANVNISDLNGGFTDNCGIASVTIDNSSFNCANVGSNTVTLTVTDIHGNVSTCQSVVTVVDDIDPTAVCKNITVQLDANGNASIIAADVDGGSSDNCGVASLTIDKSSFTCANVGANTVTLTVTDVNGNASTCNATVTVEDKVAPVAICQNITRHVDGFGQVPFTAADIDGGSTDACGIASISVDKTNFDCSNIGVNTVTLTVTDVNGNISTCNATVTVTDEVVDYVACKNVTVYLDANGQATISAPQVDNGSFDACGIVSMTLDKTSFDCSNVGVNAFVMTVTDANGNSSTCQGEVTVVDNIDPSAICKNITVQLDANGNASITAVDVDGGSSDNCGVASVTIDNSTFTCANVGANTVTLTVTDVNGNVSTCNATVTVEDKVAPVALCKNITVQLDANGNASITAADVDSGSSDNCGVASVTIDNSSFTCANVGVNTVTLTVTDVNGNVSTCNATVTVEDKVAPVALCQNLIRHVDGNGQVVITAAEVDGGSTDACGIASISVDKTSFDCSNIGVNTVTLTVTDANGNVSTCNATVTITDEVVDYVACKNVTVYLDANGQATVSASQVNDGSSDACGIASMVLDKTSFDCSNTGVNTVTLTVTDANGNVSTCQAEVLVKDNIAPVVTCSQNINITPSRENCNPTVYWESAVAGDNCSASLSSTHNPGDAFPVGTTTVTYTATDPSGNSTSCSFTVTVTPEPLIGSVSAKTYAGGYNVSCYGAADGEATVSVNGGCLPYQYYWNTSPVQTGATATGLAAGVYAVTVTDANGSVITLSINITQPALLVASAGSNQTVYFGYNSQFGCATLNATAGGGVAPYTYAWSNGSTASSITVCPSASTVYTATVKDANGCVSVNTVKVCVIDVRCEKGGNAIVYYTGGKVLVCHVPDGDQSKKFTICIAPSAVPDHLAHGDVLGVCGTSTECISAGKTEEEVVQTSLVTEENIGLTSYPNPFANETTVRFYSTQAGTIDVSIYNLLGEKVATLFNGAVLANEVHEEKLKANSLTNGTYFVKVITEQGDVKVERVILSR